MLTSSMLNYSEWSTKVSQQTGQSHNFVKCLPIVKLLLLKRSKCNKVFVKDSDLTIF